MGRIRTYLYQPPKEAARKTLHIRYSLSFEIFGIPTQARCFPTDSPLLVATLYTSIGPSPFYTRYSLNSFKGVTHGILWGTMGGIKRDFGTLDPKSLNPKPCVN